MCVDPPIRDDCYSLRDDLDYCQQKFNDVDVNYLISHVVTRVLKRMTLKIDILTQFKENYEMIQSNGIGKKFTEQYSDIYDFINHTIKSVNVIKIRLEKLNIGKAEQILTLGNVCRGALDGDVPQKDDSINCAYLASNVENDLRELVNYSNKHYMDLKDRYE
ncbi:hypothetical protein AYI70_g372 [Smittium culicis]|uniref:Uncharacterized protein n=1 Tax=Smittium culicis TaxID=133412 RepID=A0A1R1YGZ8_9FUNG|nr:hypothetical protein AYI70_g372 [Smittium culicis]